jgi:uncharacterized protein
MQLKDRVVLITGASSGIGAEMSVRFAQEGATVIMTARSADKLGEVAARVKAAREGNPHEVITMDVSKTEEVNRVVERVLSKFGRIDVLVNNAGYAVFEACVDASIGQYESMMDVNYMGMVRCTKAVLPHMLAQGSGHIVNTASIVGKIGSAKSTAYAASKHAVLGFTNSLRLELAGTGVLVSAVNPGPVRTPFFDKADPGGFYTSNPKVQRFMITPEQVAEATVKVVQHRKIQKDIPGTAGFVAKVFHLFPSTFERIAVRFMNLK